MATITRSLSSKVNGNGESEIMLRLTVSRELRLRLRSGVFIEPSRFRDGKFIMPRADRKTLENPGADDPCGQVDLTPENNLFLTPEEFGRRGQFYFGLSAFEGFELTDAFAGERDTVCGVDDAVEDGIRHCGVADGVVPVQFGEL